MRRRRRSWIRCWCGGARSVPAARRECSQQGLFFGPAGRGIEEAVVAAVVGDSRCQPGSSSGASRAAWPRSARSPNVSPAVLATIKGRIGLLGGGRGVLDAGTGGDPERLESEQACRNRSTEDPARPPV